MSEKRRERVVGSERQRLSRSSVQITGIATPVRVISPGFHENRTEAKRRFLESSTEDRVLPRICATEKSAKNPRTTDRQTDRQTYRGGNGGKKGGEGKGKRIARWRVSWFVRTGLYNSKSVDGSGGTGDNGARKEEKRRKGRRGRKARKEGEGEVRQGKGEMIEKQKERKRERGREASSAKPDAREWPG